MTAQQIQQRIGQAEAGINAVEPFLDDEDFKEYCDAAYTCITYLKLIKKQTKE